MIVELVKAKLRLFFLLLCQPARTHITSVQFEPDGDVITADSDGIEAFFGFSLP